MFLKHMLIFIYLLYLPYTVLVYVYLPCWVGCSRPYKWTTAAVRQWVGLLCVCVLCVQDVHAVNVLRPLGCSVHARGDGGCAASCDDGTPVCKYVCVWFT